MTRVDEQYEYSNYFRYVRRVVPWPSGRVSDSKLGDPRA